MTQEMQVGILNSGLELKELKELKDKIIEDKMILWNLWNFDFGFGDGASWKLAVQPAGSPLRREDLTGSFNGAQLLEVFLALTNLNEGCDSTVCAAGLFKRRGAEAQRRKLKFLTTLVV
jgi:hypothetical protein